MTTRTVQVESVSQEASNCFRVTVEGEAHSLTVVQPGLPIGLPGNAIGGEYLTVKGERLLVWWTREQLQVPHPQQ